CHGDHRDLHSFPTRRSSDLCGLRINSGGTPGDVPGTPSGKTGLRSPASFFLELKMSPGIHSIGSKLLMLSQPASGKVSAVAMKTDRKSTRLNSSHVEISYAV